VAASALTAPEHLLPGPAAASHWELSARSLFLAFPKQPLTTMVFLKDGVILKVKFKEDSSAERLL